METINTLKDPIEGDLTPEKAAELNEQEHRANDAMHTQAMRVQAAAGRRQMHDAAAQVAVRQLGEAKKKGETPKSTQPVRQM